MHQVGRHVALSPWWRRALLSFREQLKTVADAKVEEALKVVNDVNSQDTELSERHMKRLEKVRPASLFWSRPTRLLATSARPSAGRRTA